MGAVHRGGGAVGRRVPGTTGVVAGMLVAALVALPFGLVQAGADLLTPALLAAGLGWPSCPAPCPTRWKWWP
ncbi:hypothetical protein ACFSC4_01595 [Deinococcus malanensis]|uniref:hypothetical protein n=1 Tax=Deinococcus malanensis TaxID=1706855 RepID=UPI003632C2E8